MASDELIEDARHTEAWFKNLGEEGHASLIHDLADALAAAEARIEAAVELCQRAKARPTKFNTDTVLAALTGEADDE